MLIDNQNTTTQRYDVKIDGVICKKGVIKPVAENYIATLDTDLQSKATIIPVTDTGEEILFG